MLLSVFYQATVYFVIRLKIKLVNAMLTYPHVRSPASLIFTEAHSSFTSVLVSTKY